MESHLLAFAIVLLLYRGTLVDSAHWSYSGSQGPASWPGVCQTGKMQSPIDIVKKDLKALTMKAINLVGYEKPPTSITLSNNGHSAYVKPTWASPPEMSGGPLKDDTYICEQIHFHWGVDDYSGSEHLIDSKSFPLEMHIVHRNKKYATIPEALQKSDGLSVLGVLFNIQQGENPHFTPVTEVLVSIAEPKAEMTIRGVMVNTMIPSNLTNFYTYHGSLTTPTCDEVVTWIVLANPVGVGSRQLNQFRVLMDETRDSMGPNFRPVQPLGTRVVMKSVIIDSGAAKINISTAVLTGLVAIFVASRF